MKSLRQLYKIGLGPSSSHTMGPEKACKIINEKYENADSFIVTLRGSLAMTGEGHGTDKVIKSTLSKPTTVIFDKITTDLPHENTMDVSVIKNGKEIDCKVYC